MKTRTPRRIYSELLEARRRLAHQKAGAGKDWGPVVLTLGQELWQAEQQYVAKPYSKADVYADCDGDEAKARNSDPATSHEAAKRLSRDRVAFLNEEIFRCLRETDPFGQSMQSTADYVRQPYKTISPRFAPLRRQNRIHVVGRSGGCMLYRIGPAPGGEQIEPA